MPDTVEVPPPVEDGAAMGRLVSRVLCPRPGPSELARVIADAKAEAHAAGLTDADIDAELDAYNAERRDDPATHTRLERLIRRTLRPTDGEALFAAMDALSDEARRRGLTDQILQAELEAYNAERRDQPPTA